MVAVNLSIVQPAHDRVFHQGETQVRLVGQVGPLPPELAGVPLHYRWYSSLFPAQKDHYSIHAAALSDPAVPFDALVGPGSQAITLAASDRPGETEADQNATAHGGVTGGAAGPTQCVIHVLRAVPLAPDAGETLSKASDTLEVEAPLHWGREIDTTEVYEPNPEYHGLNRLHFLWLFTPTPADGRASATLDPGLGGLTFVPGTPPRLRYQGPLPAVLGLGAYTLTWRVQDTTNGTIGHQVSRPVTITA
ncbi:MAG TPA: hypothetical protein VHL09_10830 [Dehalococcoidia bacterium]|nr:hypothetical protein [Dehalococcoidia bacterium]